MNLGPLTEEKYLFTKDKWTLDLLFHPYTQNTTYKKHAYCIRSCITALRTENRLSKRFWKPAAMYLRIILVWQNRFNRVQSVHEELD